VVQDGVQPQLRFQSDREICATWGPVVIRICDGVRTEVEDLVRVQRVFDELLATHETVAMLLVFTHGTPLPDGPTHRYTKEAMAGYGDRVIFGVALLGMGFWASTVSAAMGLIARALGRGTVFIEKTVERACGRLAAELVGLDADKMLAVYQQLWDQLVSRARRAS
jgi:hypothetical protein